MSNINKEMCMRGCRLVTKVTDDTSNVYQFVFNPKTEDFSEIYSCSEPLEFELDVDGVYEIVTLRNNDAVLEDGGLKIGVRVFSAREIIDSIESVWLLGDTEYDIDETISICNLKKCLVNLQMKAFQDMLKNCGSVKCKSDVDKAQRDFLFIAVWLIEQYLDLGNIERAREIYECIQTCGSICNELLKNKHNCGCNG